MTGDKSGGPRKAYMVPMHAPLERAGFAWFSINYRLAPQFRYPAPVDDVETAIRWVRDSMINALPGTQPINISNSQNSRLEIENVLVSSPPGQNIQVVANAVVNARRLSVIGAGWESSGRVSVTDSLLAGGRISILDGGVWVGSGNKYEAGVIPPAGDKKTTPLGVNAGAETSQFKIPPQPVPHRLAGRFPSLKR